MDEALDSLSKADGVFGVVVFDDHWTCVADRLSAPFEPVLLTRVVKRLSAAFDAFCSIEDGDVAAFAADCQDGSILLRRVDRYWLVVLAYLEYNMSMVNVAMNVAARTLSRGAVQDGTPLARPGPVDSAATLPAASSSFTPTAFPLAAPPDALDRSVVQQLLVIFTEYLGPAAKLVMKQQLEAMGATSRTLRRAQLDEFLARLTAKIPVPQRQREFAAATREYLGRVRV
jgi:hypothetical protein